MCKFIDTTFLQKIKMLELLLYRIKSNEILLKQSIEKITEKIFTLPSILEQCLGIRFLV
jgi:hypothetical protein